MMSSSSNKCESENTSSSKYSIDHEKKVLSDQAVVGSGKPPLSLTSEVGTGRPITPTAQAHLVPVREMPVGVSAGTARAVTAIKRTSVTHIAGAGLAPQFMALEAVADMSQPMHPQHNVIEKSNDGDKKVENEMLSQAKKFVNGKQPNIGFDAMLLEATSYAKEDSESRRRRGNTKPAHKTQVDYEKKYSRFLMRVNQADGNYEDKVKAALLPYAVSKNSFKSMRAAAKFMLKKTMAAITLRAAEANRLNGRRHELEEEVAQRLKQQLELLRALDSIDRLDILQAQKKQTQRVRSKKNQLPLLKDGWQDKFLLHNERSPTYCDAGVLMRFCGLREAEFEAGVDVELKQQDVIVKILGAKVRPGISGQPWRIMKLNADLLPRRFLEKLKVASRLKIAVSPEGFRQHVKRTTEEVIGRVMDGDRRVWLTPYLFRHALVTDLRYAGWEQQDIARVLGELAVDTVRVYGRRVRSGSKNPSSIAIVRASVQAALPVRESPKKGVFSFDKTKHRKVPHV